jgi:hypothetical protein
METLRLAPLYAKRKIALALGLRSRKDLFIEDLESGGEICKGVT